MHVSNARVSPTIAVAGAATFGALAAMLTIVLGPALQPSFPILLYLKFDFAEVVDVMAFLIFGPVSGLLTAIVHGGILAEAPGGAGPFGATLKFLAVLTTYEGISLASRLGKQTFQRAGVSMVIFSVVTRVLVMTVVNYLFIIFFAKVFFNQDYLGYAQYLLGVAGINLSGPQLVGYILGLTAAFNAIHAVFTVTVSIVIVGALLKRAPQLLESRAWFVNYLRKRSE
jgi:riboflavin transporter FmnP